MRCSRRWCSAATLILLISFCMCVALAAPRRDLGKDKCRTCREIVKKFHEGEEKTAKSIHFSGGNPEGWTLEKEKFLGKYSMGEARLVEILEQTCTHGDHACAELQTDMEEHIEEWWRREPGQRANLTQWLCIETAKLCCPDGKFGKDCAACPATAAGVCHGRGTCNGDGTRGGTGKCACNYGFGGKSCNKCAKTHFAVDEACELCHASCDRCTGPTAGNCTACKSGYSNESSVCTDINECAQQSATCAVGQYCENTPGSFSCINCHPGCKDGCKDGSLSSCVACAAGYRPAASGAGCEDIDECATGDVTCTPGTYCANREGSHDCERCPAGCQSCTGPAAADCAACDPGYSRDAGGWCADNNECKSFPCPGSKDCNNTAGSYECLCIAPNRMEGDACVAPPSLSTNPPAALSEEALLALRAQFDAAEDKVTDKAQVGSSRTRVKALHVRFPIGRFELPPTLLPPAAVDVCCGDEFEAHAQEITSEGFELVVRRTDSQSGWGQELVVQWQAFAAPPAPKEEL